MTLKDNYLELSKKFGGPYRLMKLGIKKGIIDSIMRGSCPKADELLPVAKVLDSSIEALLEGPEVVNSKASPEKISLINTQREKEYIAKLKKIFKNKDGEAISAVTKNIDALLRVPDDSGKIE